ncbi:MAG: enoyl-CoA hydratase-related protein [Bacteriovoracaceae bacterium]
MFEFIKYDLKGMTSIITINRPEVFNAMNVKTKKEIIEAIKQANKDSAIRSIILTGAGKAFSSGQDLNDRTVQASAGPVDLGHTVKTEWNPLVEAIRNSDKPVIAAINGVCAGAGLGVALACDFKVAKPQVKFVSGFAQIGLTPDAGTSHILSRHLGYSKALEFALLGQALFSEDMLNYGLVNFIADDEMSKALELGEKLNNLAPKSVATIKKNFQYGLDNKFEAVSEKEMMSQRYLGWTKDYQEGVSAFLEKRKPQFKGE